MTNDNDLNRQRREEIERQIEENKRRSEELKKSQEDQLSERNKKDDGVYGRPVNERPSKDEDD